MRDASQELLGQDRNNDGDSEPTNEEYNEVADLVDDRSDSELTISSGLDEIEILDRKAERQDRKRKLKMEKGKNGKERKGRKQSERVPTWFCNYAEEWLMNRKRRHEDDDSSDGGRDNPVPNKARRKHMI